MGKILRWLECSTKCLYVGCIKIIGILTQGITRADKICS